MNRSSIAIVALCAVALMVAVGADVFSGHPAGSDYLNAFKIGNGGEHSAGIRYFRKAVDGSLTSTRDSSRSVTYLSVANTSASEVVIWLYGDFGTNDPGAAPTVNYTIVPIPPNGTFEQTNLRIYGMRQITDPAATPTYYLVR